MLLGVLTVTTVSLTARIQSTAGIILDAINRVFPFDALGFLVKEFVGLIPYMATVFDNTLIAVVNSGLGSAEEPMRKSINSAILSIPESISVTVPL